MAKIVRHGSLDLDEDPAFQRRMWRVERLGTGAMMVFFLAAALGIFGNGPLSTAHVADPAGRLGLEHERFGRFQAPLTLRFSFAPDTGQDGKVRVWVDRQFLQTIKLDNISPEPETTEAAGDRCIYTFRVAEPHRATGCAMHYQAEGIGRLRGRVGLEGGEAIDFQQFIYP